MKRRKPVVGETLYSLNVGNAAWHGIKQELTPVVVVSVGHKYFKASERRMINRPITYHLEDWVEAGDYEPDSRLYESPQAWEDGVSNKLIFGKTRIQNPHAGRRNPRKIGIYVETVIRRSMVNPGTFYRVTNGRGDFWLTPKDGCVILAIPAE